MIKKILIREAKIVSKGDTVTAIDATFDIASSKYDGINQMRVSINETDNATELTAYNAVSGVGKKQQYADFFTGVVQARYDNWVLTFLPVAEENFKTEDSFKSLVGNEVIFRA